MILGDLASELEDAVQESSSQYNYDSILKNFIHWVHPKKYLLRFIELGEELGGRRDEPYLIIEMIPKDHRQESHIVKVRLYDTKYVESGNGLSLCLVEKKSVIKYIYEESEESCVIK